MRAALITLLLHIIGTVIAYAASGALLRPGQQSAVWLLILRILLAPFLLIEWLSSAAGSPMDVPSTYGYLGVILLSSATWAFLVAFLWPLLGRVSRPTI